MKRQKTSFSCNVWVAGLLLLAACSDSPKDVVQSVELPQIYPDYVGVTVPLDIAPLDFAMLSDSVSVIDVEVTGSKGGSLHANGESAEFDIDEWHSLLAANRGDSLTVSVCARQDGRWTRYRDFSIYVSRDSIGAWGITYRRIPPGYEQYGLMGLYQRCLSNFEETPLVENRQSPGTCLNCHTSNRTNPDQYVYHARGDNAGTFMHNTHHPSPNTRHLTRITVQGDSLFPHLNMVYPYWHPDGRYIAFSSNKTSQMFHLSGRKRIEVYDAASDVFVYDTETQTALIDTLIMRKYWAENTPAFSPDGRWLYFTTARRQVYPTDYDKERYSLCRVSFDASTGSLGQTVDTLISAYQTGKSATWPRLSYDGRYLMYTQADYGYFSIWHPEADLWLLDLSGDNGEVIGDKRPLDEVNSDRSDSFHNWSLNSRWFLFTSRRDDGLYTRVYFSSIDDDGHATKPFMLPQRNPKVFYRLLLHSYNTPDFTLHKVVTDVAGANE